MVAPAAVRCAAGARIQPPSWPGADVSYVHGFGVREPQSAVIAPSWLGSKAFWLDLTSDSTH
jgi:hypothetical protein